MSQHHDRSPQATVPWLTITIGAVALFIQLIPNNCVQLLEMDRNAVLSQYALCQTITGHLTHWNFEHLWADLAVFIGIGWMIEKKSRVSFSFITLLSALAISGSVLWLHPEINHYRGLSGIDMALAAFWITNSLSESIQKRHRFETCLFSVGLFGVITKPAIEIAIGHPIFIQDLGSNVVGMPIPHIVGAIVGIALAFIRHLTARIPPKAIIDELVVFSLITISIFKSIGRAGIHNLELRIFR